MEPGPPSGSQSHGVKQEMSTATLGGIMEHGPPRLETSEMTRAKSTESGDGQTQMAPRSGLQQETETGPSGAQAQPQRTGVKTEQSEDGDHGQKTQPQSSGEKAEKSQQTKETADGQPQSGQRLGKKTTGSAEETRAASENGLPRSGAMPLKTVKLETPNGARSSEHGTPIWTANGAQREPPLQAPKPVSYTHLRAHET